MTQKIARFLADQAPATPCLIVDLDLVAANFRKLQTALPEAAIYYAVKANPAPEILERLVELGSAFDTASVNEIDMVLAAGAAPERISFGNTIKKASCIRAAYERGVRLFAFDSAEEVEKIARAVLRIGIFETDRDVAGHIHFETSTDLEATAAGRFRIDIVTDGVGGVGVTAARQIT